MRFLAALCVFVFIVWAVGRAIDVEQGRAGMLPEPVTERTSSASGGQARLVGTGSESTPALIEGKTIGWWHARAVRNRREANQQRRNSEKRGRTIRRLKGDLARRYEPSFEHYFTIAARTYADGLRARGYTRADLERRGRCESVNFTDFYNETPIYNGEHAQGVMGFIPSTFNSTPYAGLDVQRDHLANIMAGAWMHSVGRGGEWACR